jgi:hypothetical protein
MNRIELNGKADAETIFAELKNVANKGANVYVEWLRDAKTRKDCQQRIQKRVIAPVRYGIAYANIGEVKNAIASGLREEIQPLPWGTWRKGFENMIIDHKGIEYCRLAAGTFENMTRQTEWTIDGKPATYEQALPFLLASEKPTEEKPLVFCVKADSLQAILYK